MSSDFEAVIIDNAIDLLSNGSMPLAGLIEDLRLRGVLGPLAECDDEELIDQFDELLGYSDAVWTTDDGVVAATAVMLDGIFFSRRITAEEIRRDALRAVPDLTVLFFDVEDGIDLNGGGQLRNEFGNLNSDVDEVVGPAGWLRNLAPDQVVSLSRVGSAISMSQPSTLASGEREAQALRTAFEMIHTDGVSSELTQVVLDAICRDGTLFRVPTPPIDELLERCELARDGEWLSRQGEDAEPPGVIARRYRLAELADHYDFEHCCVTAFEFVLAAWSDWVLSKTLPLDPKKVAVALAHSTVSAAFAEYVLEEAPMGSPHLEAFASALARLQGKFSAPAHLLLGLNAERDGQTSTAERHLKLATLADRNFSPALIELSWYESDRGHLDAAVSLLRRAGIEDENPRIEALLDLLSATAISAERNDPCPCGSGRKFKVCCLRNPKLPPSLVREVLQLKLSQFAFRPQHRWRVREIFDEMLQRADEERAGGATSTLMDLALYDVEFLTLFLDERGELFTDEEHSLIHAWMGARRSLWQVVDVVAGASVRLLDTCTGDSIEVSERNASQTLQVGTYVFARLMEDGGAWFFESDILLVPMQYRDSLLAILVEGGDAWDIAAWLGRLFGPITMVNYEGEPIVVCRLVLSPSTTPWSELESILNRLLEPAGPARWKESVEVDGSATIRCFLERVGDTLVITTNSLERRQRILSHLLGHVDDLEIVEDEQIEMGSERAKEMAQSGSESGFGDSPPPEAMEALQQLVREQESRWLDESIPALSGLTPRQAAADPTRREDLVALLNEFDLRHAEGAEFATFDVSRLRRELGIPN